MARELRNSAPWTRPAVRAPQMSNYSRPNPYTVRLESADYSIKTQQPPQRRRGRLQRWWTDGWLYELLIVAFSAALDVALCIVLKHYDGQPLPMFGTLINSGITLNTVVSLLATFSVAASILVVEEGLGQLKWLWYTKRSRPLTDIETYDEATRGSLGSMQLLWKLRLRPLPSFGAILIVIHLLIAPLTQQSVVTQLTSTPSDDPEGAKAPQNNIWNTSISTESNLMPGGYNRINTTMKGAVLSGVFFDDDAMPEIAPICTSGNCSFPLHTSLAICASVADVSDHLTKTVIQPGTNSTSQVRWCLPGNHCLNATGQYPTVAWARSAADSHAGDNWHLGEHLTMLNITSAAFADSPAPVADFYLFYRNATHPGYEATDKIRPVEEYQYSAMELLLEWCVPTFNTSVLNGVASTTRLANVSREFNVPANFDKADGKGSHEPITGAVNGTAYRVDQFTHDTLQRYLWRTFAGDIDVPARNDTPHAGFNLTFTDSDAAQAVWSSTQVGRQDQWDDGIHQVRSSTEAVAAALHLMNNTATSMTNIIRKQSKQESHPGLATVAQNIVTIEWGYVVTLVGFTGASLIFLLIVMAMEGRPTHHRQTRPPVLKSSTFALVRCLDADLQSAYGGMRHVSSMEKDASAIRVQLVAQPNGSWKLIPTQAPVAGRASTLQISRPFRSSSNLPNDRDLKRNTAIQTTQVSPR